jgi:hypothetical protein
MKCLCCFPLVDCSFTKVRRRVTELSEEENRRKLWKVVYWTERELRRTGDEESADPLNERRAMKGRTSQQFVLHEGRDVECFIDLSYGRDSNDRARPP